MIDPMRYPCMYDKCYPSAKMGIMCNLLLNKMLRMPGAIKIFGRAN